MNIWKQIKSETNNWIWTKISNNSRTLDNFKPVFWGYYVVVLVQRVSFIAQKHIMQKRRFILGCLWVAIMVGVIVAGIPRAAWHTIIIKW